MKFAHLGRRFFASVVARRLSVDERAWVTGVLTAAELAVWERQPRYDQRHSLGVAHRVDEALGDASEPRWLAAALVHDVGKVEARLGILGRVIATLAMMILGRARVRSWTQHRGVRGRFGRYADHGPIGARLLREAGGRAEPARWAEVHHGVKSDHPGTTRPDLPQQVVLALRESDHD